VGEGAGAACGDIITIHLTVWNAAGGKAYDGELPLAIGSRELAAGLDAGLIGIRPGGERTLMLPPSALVRGKATKVPAAALKALPQGKLAVVSVKRVE
jgi:FKBP-type peptidyl-prolyl cis-trans isomerase (trigger factor)